MTESRGKKVIAELLGGTVGGVLQAITGHPLDTIKVRLQSQGSQKNYSGAMDCFKKTLQHEGIRGLFKGLSSPMFMSGALNAVIFGTNFTMRRIVSSFAGVPARDLNLGQVTIAAWMTVPIYCAAVCPVDLVKNRLQFQSSFVKLKYSGPIDCVVKTIKEEGLVGLQRGYLATCAMRAVGLPFYFMVNDATKRLLAKPGQHHADVEAYKILIAGGCAGSAFWTVNYPIDTIKTRIQTSSASVSEVLRATRTLVHQEGIRRLYQGFVPCFLRAFPSNAVAFFGVEVTLRALGQQS
eukprot:m.19833 g.19833  ORF g.19833 m.19833 type:complete len:294 (+) comp12330_c0_seq1:60-941(+)